jgi:hypothetical protein
MRILVPFAAAERAVWLRGKVWGQQFWDSGSFTDDFR